MNDELNENIRFQVPVKISYKALEGFLRKEMQGEFITTTGNNGEVTKYAEILDIALAKSLEPGYDLAVDVKFRTLTTFFRDKEGSVLLDASLHFDPALQKVSVEDYKFQLDTDSWLLNNSLETLVGTFFREKIKKKMNFELRPLVEEQLGSINEKLEKLEPTDGIVLSGFLSNFRVLQLLPGQELLLIIVEVEGRALVQVDKIPDLP